ncbi:hypothetical protein BKD30_04230 [Tersicoccus phoenicis]|uniref:Type II secretion system protein GspF domain-containing protein n=1 Tax=Tersicoccus phoenicis TaxID=554083 RepID=A0A1R1LHK6_9MICC|nr:hypothetical protein BKD30_04230 [Tersicoccus phoenicis]
MTGLLLSLLCGAAVVVAGLPASAHRGEPGIRPGTLRREGPARPRARGSGPPRSSPDAALLLDLLAAMFEAGVAIDPALDLLSRLHPLTVGPQLERVVAARRLGADWPTATAMTVRMRPPRSAGGKPLPRDAPAALGPLLEAVLFAATTGAPSAALLRSRASDLRVRRRQETERRAASLGVRLVLPLGLCQLPAFICLGIVPVVLALLPALRS